MKTKSIISGSLFAVVALGLTLTSCKKDTTDQDSTVAENYSVSEKAGEDLDAMGDETEASNSMASFKTASETGILTESATITKTICGDTVKVLIDFGAGVTCKDGKVRKGKINIVRLGGFMMPGTKRTATTDNYYVNDNKVDATRVVEFKGKNSSGNPYWTISSKITITLASGAGSIEAETARTREWSKGFNTPYDRSDDQFTISGTASGTKVNGSSVTVTITTPLVVSVSCHQIVSGVIEIVPSGKTTRVINYGTGDCDNVATLTIGTYTKTIDSKK